MNTDNSLYQSLSHKKIIYETKMRRHEVYISYAWGGESEIIVTEICQQLQNNKVKYYIDKNKKGDITIPLFLLIISTYPTTSLFNAK